MNCNNVQLRQSVNFGVKFKMNVKDIVFQINNFIIL